MVCILPANEKVRKRCSSEKNVLRHPEEPHFVVCGLQVQQQKMPSFTGTSIKIAWAERNTMFFVLSNNLPDLPGFSTFKRLRYIRNISLVIAVFAAFPLKIIGIFEYILEQYTLFDHDINKSIPPGINLIEDGKKAQGLPINIKIKERPPPKNSTISNEAALCSFNEEPEICDFHADQSGRIVHMLARHGVMRVYKLKEINGSKMKLELEQVAEVDRRNKASIHSVDYQDDFDLTYISVTNMNTNKVCFYDNSNMKLVRELCLEFDEQQAL
ncbi:hypothetical protein DPMN_124496, partial [Dreissena polymorpha]